MKEELLAIRTVLQAGIIYVADTDIFVVEDEKAIRPSGGYPAIGIKDGNSSYVIDAGDQQEVTQEITLNVYILPTKVEVGIISETGFKGVLDVASDIMNLLRNNLLGNIVSSAIPVSVSGSNQITDGNKIIIMATVTMQYIRFDQI